MIVKNRLVGESTLEAFDGAFGLPQATLGGKTYGEGAMPLLRE